MSSFLESQGLDSRTPKATDPAWLAALRKRAIADVQASGLPSSKTEAWRFTSLRSLESRPAPPVQVGPSDAALSWAREQLGDDGTHRLFLVNGRPTGTFEATPGLEVLLLSDTLASNPGLVEPHLGKIAHTKFFAGLNSALFEDGYVVRIAAEYGDTPLHIVHISAPADEGCASYPRLLIDVAANAKVDLIETYLAQPGHRDVCTAVTEMHLSDGAIVDHLRVIEGSDESSHLGTLAVLQDRNSNYTSRSVVMGGKLSRLEIDARMTGPGAECHLDGMYHAVGSEHVAHHTLITHADSHCSSTEEYRGLIDDRGHAVFDGIIIVDQGTQGTSAHQQNHNLLLSETATVNTKPHLEIDSDDLSASHGATVGSVDPDQLFFLRARGIDEEHARSILTFSFVRSILDQIRCEPVREKLTEKLLSRLPYGADIAELAK